jgi:GTPase SAR1 family protein
MVRGLRDINIAIVGAPKVGKTSSWTMWVNRAVLEHYECTISDSPCRIVEVDGQQFSCSLADLSHSEFTAVRDMIYEKFEGFLVLYSVTDRESFTQAEKMIKDILKVKKTAKEEGKTVKEPFFALWGTKTDALEERKVSVQQGEELAKQFGIPFVEGSTRLYDETDLAWMTLVKLFAAGPNDNRPTKRRCLIV